MRCAVDDDQHFPNSKYKYCSYCTSAIKNDKFRNGNYILVYTLFKIYVCRYYICIDISYHPFPPITYIHIYI